MSGYGYVVTYEARGGAHTTGVLSMVAAVEVALAVYEIGGTQVRVVEAPAGSSRVAA